jgi:hypothetical protein
MHFKKLNVPRLIADGFAVEQYFHRLKFLPCPQNLVQKSSQDIKIKRPPLRRHALNEAMNPKTMKNLFSDKCHKIETISPTGEQTNKRKYPIAKIRHRRQSCAKIYLPHFACFRTV